MGETALLNIFKNINNYNIPCNPIVQGIVNTDLNAIGIANELYEMLQDNFSKAELILGPLITDLVLQEAIQNKLHSPRYSKLLL